MATDVYCDENKIKCDETCKGTYIRSSTYVWPGFFSRDLTKYEPIAEFKKVENDDGELELEFHKDISDFIKYISNFDILPLLELMFLNIDKTSPYYLIFFYVIFIVAHLLIMLFFCCWCFIYCLGSCLGCCCPCCFKINRDKLTYEVVDGSLKHVGKDKDNKSKSGKDNEKKSESHNSKSDKSVDKECVLPLTVDPNGNPINQQEPPPALTSAAQPAVETVEIVKEDPMPEKPEKEKRVAKPKRKYKHPCYKCWVTCCCCYPSARKNNYSKKVKWTLKGCLALYALMFFIFSIVCWSYTISVNGLVDSVMKITKVVDAVVLLVSDIKDPTANLVSSLVGGVGITAIDKLLHKMNDPLNGLLKSMGNVTTKLNGLPDVNNLTDSINELTGLLNAIDDDFKDDLQLVSSNFNQLKTQSSNLTEDRYKIIDIQTKINSSIEQLCNDNDKIKEVNKFFDLTLFELPKEIEDSMTPYNEKLSSWKISQTNETLISVQKAIHKIYLKESQFQIFCGHTQELEIKVNSSDIDVDTLKQIETALGNYNVTETFKTMKSISNGLDTAAFERLNTSLVGLNSSVNDITSYNYTKLSEDIGRLKDVQDLIDPLNKTLKYIDEISEDFIDLNSLIGGFGDFSNLDEVSGELVEKIDDVLDQIDEIKNKTDDLSKLNLNDKIRDLNNNLKNVTELQSGAMGSLLSDLEKTTNAITYGIFKNVENFESIVQNVQNFKQLASFYKSKESVIATICGIHTNDLYKQSSNLNKIFTQGLNSTNQRCSPPDAKDTTTTTTTPSADPSVNSYCNMSFVGYGYCSLNQAKRCLDDRDCDGDGDCNDSPKTFDFPSGYDSSFSSYKSNVIDNIVNQNCYINSKSYFSNMEAYDKYIENGDEIATGYFSHCTALKSINKLYEELPTTIDQFTSAVNDSASGDFGLDEVDSSVGDIAKAKKEINKINMDEYVNDFNSMSSVLGSPTELMGVNCTEIDESVTSLSDEMKLGMCNAYDNKDGFTNFINNVSNFLEQPVYDVLSKFNESELQRLTKQSKLDNAFKAVEDQLNIVYASVISPNKTHNNTIKYFQTDDWTDIKRDVNKVWDVDHIEGNSLDYLTFAGKLLSDSIKDDEGYIMSNSMLEERNNGEMCISYGCIERSIRLILEGMNFKGLMADDPLDISFQDEIPIVGMYLDKAIWYIKTYIHYILDYIAIIPFFVAIIQILLLFCVFFTWKCCMKCSWCCINCCGCCCCSTCMVITSIVMALLLLIGDIGDGLGNEVYIMVEDVEPSICNMIGGVYDNKPNCTYSLDLMGSELKMDIQITPLLGNILGTCKLQGEENPIRGITGKAAETVTDFAKDMINGEDGILGSIELGDETVKIVNSTIDQLSDTLGTLIIELGDVIGCNSLSRIVYSVVEVLICDVVGRFSRMVVSIWWMGLMYFVFALPLFFSKMILTNYGKGQTYKIVPINEKEPVDADNVGVVIKKDNEENNNVNPTPVGEEKKEDEGEKKEENEEKKVEEEKKEEGEVADDEKEEGEIEEDEEEEEEKEDEKIELPPVKYEEFERPDYENENKEGNETENENEENKEEKNGENEEDNNEENENNENNNEENENNENNNEESENNENKEDNKDEEKKEVEDSGGDTTDEEDKFVMPNVMENTNRSAVKVSNASVHSVRLEPLTSPIHNEIDPDPIKEESN